MEEYPRWLQIVLDEEINAPILSDKRTLENPGTFLGWPCGRIFNDVIQFGQADFTQGINALSAEDRALLYAKYNQPRHIDELLAAFRQLMPNGESPINPTVIDLGCGPFTAGLAFSAALQSNAEFRYIGIDRAMPMLDLAKRLFDAAQRVNGISFRTSAIFGTELSKINFGTKRGNLTAVVASYLIASTTLVIADLIEELVDALDRCGPGPAAVLITNSALPHLNKNFDAFKRGLLDNGFTVVTDLTETFFETSKDPKLLHYALFVRPSNTNVII